MTCIRATTVTILALIAASVSLTACGSGGKHVSIAPQQAHQDFAYAYQVPINPSHPENGEWSTLVRMRPVSAGYRLSVGSPQREWVVTAVRSIPQNGQHAAVRGWRGPNPIWHGRLVLRPA